MWEEQQEPTEDLTESTIVFHGSNRDGSRQLRSSECCKEVVGLACSLLSSCRAWVTVMVQFTLGGA